MKRFLTFTLTLAVLSPLTFAEDDSPFVIPFCDDAKVRLAPEKPNCLERDYEKIFDIPELEINKEDTEKILQGAESSGGRIKPTDFSNSDLGRMSTRTAQRPEPFRYECSLRLLADGGKTISWLSQTQATLTHMQPTVKLSRADWSHGLIEGNRMDLGLPVTLVSGVEPKVLLEEFSLAFYQKKDSSRVRIEVCHQDVDQSLDKKVSVCSSARGRRKTRRLRTNLSYTTVEKFEGGTYKQTLSLDLSCRKKR